MDIKEKNNLLEYQEGNEFNKIIKKKQFQLVIPDLKYDDIILSQEQIKKMELECQCAPIDEDELEFGLGNCCEKIEIDNNFKCKNIFESEKPRKVKEIKFLSIKRKRKKKLKNSKNPALLEGAIKRGRGRARKCPPTHIEEIETSKYNSFFNNSIICPEVGKNINVYNVINFDDIILAQDIIEGNWKKNKNIELLIEEEKILYEKIKNFSENKGIKDENGIITLFILYYIYEKKNEKVEK